MSAPIIIVGGTPDDWGSIPSFLDTDDPRSAREQLNAHYVSGWVPFEGHSFNPKTFELHYPDDPPMKPIGVLLFRDERVILFPYGWVMVLQKEGSYEVCRMD